MLVSLVLSPQRDDSLLRDPFYFVGLGIHVALVAAVAYGSGVGWLLLVGSSALALVWWLLEMGSETFDVACAVLLAAALAVLFAPPLRRHVRPRPSSSIEGDDPIA